VTWIAVASDDRRFGEHERERDGRPGGDARGKRARSSPSCWPRESWDHVVLASAADGGEARSRGGCLVTRAGGLPDSRRAAAGQSWARMAARALGERRLDPLDGASAWGSAWLLGWSEIDAPASRRPGLPLWDGDLVLALSGLSGASGGPTIEAFATLTESWSGVDLVAWSHPAIFARAAGARFGDRDARPSRGSGSAPGRVLVAGSGLGRHALCGTAGLHRARAAHARGRLSSDLGSARRPIVRSGALARRAGVRARGAGRTQRVTQALSDMLDRDSEWSA
jgi:hypothetical protein